MTEPYKWKTEVPCLTFQFWLFHSCWISRGRLVLGSSHGLLCSTSTRFPSLFSDILFSSSSSFSIFSKEYRNGGITFTSVYKYSCWRLCFCCTCCCSCRCWICCCCCSCCCWWLFFFVCCCFGCCGCLSFFLSIKPSLLRHPRKEWGLPTLFIPRDFSPFTGTSGNLTGLLCEPPPQRCFSWRCWCNWC